MMTYLETSLLVFVFVAQINPMTEYFELVCLEF